MNSALSSTAPGTFALKNDVAAFQSGVLWYSADKRTFSLYAGNSSPQPQSDLKVPEGAYPQAIAQARYQNMHPTGKIDIEERLNGLMEEDGITNCGNAQNCVQVCPMSIPLTRAIYETNRDITVNALFGWLKK